MLARRMKLNLRITPMHGHLVRVTAPRVIDNFASYRPCRRRRQIEKEKTEKEKTEKIELDRSCGLWTWILEIPELNPTGKSCGGEEWSEQ